MAFSSSYCLATSDQQPKSRAGYRDAFRTQLGSQNTVLRVLEWAALLSLHVNSSSMKQGQGTAGKMSASLRTHTSSSVKCQKSKPRMQKHAYQPAWQEFSASSLLVCNVPPVDFLMRSWGPHMTGRGSLYQTVILLYINMQIRCTLNMIRGLRGALSQNSEIGAA